MADSVRIDKWLWAVRVFKTRALATDACKAGHVKIGGNAVKPARAVHAGEIIAAYTGHLTRTVKVVAMLEHRVGAAMVPQFMEDLTPPEEFNRRPEPSVVPVSLVPRTKPSKKERRQLERFKDRL